MLLRSILFGAVAITVAVACSADLEGRAPPSSAQQGAPADPPQDDVPEPPVSVPPGILAAVPFQNRLDVAQGIFQLKLYNGTSTSFEVAAVQLVWDGLTTAVTKRSNTLVAGDRIDFPVALAPAQCAGHGTADDMPDLRDAVARVLLADGSEVEALVVDVKHFARKLYLDDCERQLIAETVAVTWVDLRQATLDGRPVTEGQLRLARRDESSRDTIIVSFVSNTINFTVDTLGPPDGAVAVLPSGQPAVDVPVRFVEGRCDAHALSESSQPFQFIAQIDLGDGLVRPYAIPPAIDDQVPMRKRVEQACAILDATGFAGQAGSSTSTSP